MTEQQIKEAFCAAGVEDKAPKAITIIRKKTVVKPKSKKKSEKSAKDKVQKVMGEYKRGKLRSGSKTGPKVTDRKQAIAIALSEKEKKEAQSVAWSNHTPEGHINSLAYDANAAPRIGLSQVSPGLWDSEVEIPRFGFDEHLGDIRAQLQGISKGHGPFRHAVGRMELFDFLKNYKGYKGLQNFVRKSAPVALSDMPGSEEDRTKRLVQFLQKDISDAWGGQSGASTPKKASYTELLTQDERAEAVKYGMFLKAAAIAPVDQCDSLIKQALVGEGLDFSAKAIVIGSLATGIPMGIMAHLLHNKVKQTGRKENELAQQIDYYRNAGADLESGLASAGATLG